MSGAQVCNFYTSWKTGICLAQSVSDRIQITSCQISQCGVLLSSDVLLSKFWLDAGVFILLGFAKSQSNGIPQKVTGGKLNISLKNFPPTPRLVDECERLQIPVVASSAELLPERFCAAQSSR